MINRNSNWRFINPIYWILRFRDFFISVVFSVAMFLGTIPFMNQLAISSRDDIIITRVSMIVEDLNECNKYFDRDPWCERLHKAINDDEFMELVYKASHSESKLGLVIDAILENTFKVSFMGGIYYTIQNGFLGFVGMYGGLKIMRFYRRRKSRRLNTN